MKLCKFRKTSFFRGIPFYSDPFRASELALPRNSECLGMSTFFRGITETIPSLFRGICSERNSVPNPSPATLLSQPVYSKFPSQLKRQVKGPVAVQRAKRSRLSLQFLLLHPDYILSHSFISMTHILLRLCRPPPCSAFYVFQYPN